MTPVISLKDNGDRLTDADLKDFLEEKYLFYNRPAFIANDPVSIPHRFTKKEDREIAGLLAAVIAWGQRPVILKNAALLVEWMDHRPYEFVLSFNTSDLKPFKKFVHRTFNGEDCLYFIRSLRNIYLKHGGLEAIFTAGFRPGDPDLKNSILNFRKIFFEIASPGRTAKHLSDPSAGSAAKRINMFLRWMVRNDRRGVDFGIWKTLTPDLLSCPLDLHSGTIARKLGLLKRKQNDWQAVDELTRRLKTFDPLDPVKYDFALFGLGVSGEI